MLQTRTHRLQASRQLTQVDRLRNLSAVPGSPLKRLMRLSFYLFGSTLRGIPGFNALFRTIAPGAWSWFDTRQNVYQVLAKRTRLKPVNRNPELERPIAGRPLDRSIRKIHQFHSGSATGDAITNSMFLMQRTLRSLGYESEIFVEHRDPALADRLLEVRDLPLHADYILIVHHSMGYDICDWIAALPARKVLMYHNITPPEFLSDAPIYAKYAKLGREQIGLLRDNVVTALADSEYNAIELRERGYQSAVTCPFLFDIDELLNKAGSRPARAADAPFTVLFVGRIIGSKGQADLVDAFAEFRKAWSRSARLVLVGRIGSPDDAYVQDIRRRIAAHNLGDDVLLTGAVSDDDLHGWYARADAYVSLSLHEGFGVPLVEAMVHGLPVIAWPAGAVAYTLGDAATLLADRSPSTTAAAILEIASHPERARAQVAEQLRSLERFRISNALPQLIEALLAAGAEAPVNQSERAALLQQLSIAVEGHTAGSYSLANVNRTLARAIERYYPGHARLISVDADHDTPSTDAAVDALLARSAPTSPEIVISQHYPTRAPEDRGDATLAMVFWEESLLPLETVAVLNRDFNGVLAPSASTAKALVDSGVLVPVRTVGFAPDLTGFDRPCPVVESGPGRPFTFLHVSSCFPRKGVDLLLAAFARAFRNSDPVRLVIKGFPNIHNDVPEQIARLKAADPSVADITMINEDIDDAAMRRLVAGADAMVLPTRGEGFNVPAAEAMAAGVPLIVTGFGGHLDFCTEAEARLVDFDFAPSVTHLQSPGSLWVEPDLDDLTSALREVFDDLTGNGTGRTLARSERAKTVVRERLDDRQWVDRVRGAAIDVMLDRPRPIRLSWISTWDVECGIAEYSNFLLEPLIDEFIARHGELTILCDERTPASAPAARPRIRPCWNGHDKDWSELARAVSVSDPDVLVIQHQPGLISWQGLAELLTDARVRNRATVITLHAAQRLSDLEPVERTATIGALRNVSRVLVHRVADINFLKQLGLHNVTLFPQGAPRYTGALPVRSLTADQPIVIGCYGFFLPGKGIDRLIEAIARLKPRWPKLALHLINAEYSEDSLREISHCQRLARRLGIADAIDWDTAFHPHEESVRRLRKCDLLVLPYEESKESSSAALRTAMASGVPVAVTPVSIFNEVMDAVHRFDRNDLDSMVEGIDALLRDEDTRRDMQRRAEQWLTERGWPDLSRRMFGMLAGLSRPDRSRGRHRDANPDHPR